MNIPDEVRQTIEDALHDAISVAEAYVEEGSWRAADMIVRYNAALAWLSQQPAAPPIPDWSQAPSWAQWWAVDRTGSSFWHEREPVRLAGQGWLSDGRRTLDSFPAEGWATTLQQRPQGQ